MRGEGGGGAHPCLGVDPEGPVFVAKECGGGVAAWHGVPQPPMEYRTAVEHVGVEKVQRVVLRQPPRVLPRAEPLHTTTGENTVRMMSSGKRSEQRTLTQRVYLLLRR